MGVLGPPATPFRRSENEGNAVLSYILHHKHGYNKREIGRLFVRFRLGFMLNIASYPKKEKEEFLFRKNRSNISSTKYEIDLLSFTAK